jgi:5-methylcytosine-specific restriction endonuclease McrA
MAVYVLDKRNNPLDPCTEKRARKLLDSGRARVHRLVPFVIRLVDRTAEESVVHHHTIRIDPGSKTTGLAVVRKTEAASSEGPTVKVVNLIELEHRGTRIRDRLTARAAFRRRRRGNLRYRPARFDNRRRPVGRLPPSLQHRVDTTMSIVSRLCRWVPVCFADMELVRFDTQLMENPEISGVAYQQGELLGYEVREYLLEKWGRCCAYCDAENVPLQVEHVVPRSRGGSDRVSNLTLACEPCNTAKAARPLVEFLAHDLPRLKRIEAKLKSPLRDAAAVNSTRWALFGALKKTGLTVATATGGRTKWNRSRFGVPKTHALDAACVGVTGAVLGWSVPTLSLKATGRGSYCRTRLNKFGFPRGVLTRSKTVRGFATGDLVVADVPKGLKAGHHVGRVAVRASGSFNVTTSHGVVQGISHRHCQTVQRGDGYAISRLPKCPSKPKKGPLSSRT